MEDISLHVLDIVENSIRSGATAVAIQIERIDTGSVSVSIVDNGAGMDEDSVEKALDPFFTTKVGKRIGLGLALFRQAAEETGGSFSVESTAGTGTLVHAVFFTDHPDMKPFGDLEGTVASIRSCHPGIAFIFECDPVEAVRLKRTTS